MTSRWARPLFMNDGTSALLSVGDRVVIATRSNTESSGTVGQATVISSVPVCSTALDMRTYVRVG
jgi:hypothetical protein